MSVCVNHVRRTLGSSAVRQRMCMSTTLSSNPIAPTITSDVTTTPIRHFAAAKKAKGKDNQNLSYQARKDAAKQKRRDQWDKQQARLATLKDRRGDGPKDVMKNLFRSWWDKEVMYHNVLQRHARQEGKPWRIRVAAMVERIPIVQPDIEEWEQEYFDLRDYLLTWGKIYPEETGFMPEEKPEDHIVPTNEELLAGLPFTPAPRETEADATGEIHTMDRQLKTSVFLAVKSDGEGNNSGPRWTLPSAIAKNDEMLLDTAARAVSDLAGKDLILWLPSNAPMAVNYRKFGKNHELKDKYFGEKIFYYRVQHDRGDVDKKLVEKNVDDWGWLAKDEIVERVEGERGVHQAKFFRYML